MIRAHKITLDPNNKQKTYFSKSAGCARFAYNWALATWNSEYEAGEKPNEASLRRKLNSIKKTEYPWMLEVTKCAPQLAIKDLGKAFNNFFAKRTSYPKFKKKGIHDSFTISNDQFKVRGKKIYIPCLGWVKMRESLRFEGKLLWATISRSADKWDVSISVEIEDQIHAENLKTNESTVGVDLGITNLATLSTGEVFANPNALEKKLKKLRRVSRSLSRKQPRSANGAKCRKKLAVLHKKIANLRSESIHKFTTDLTARFDVICLEDLNVKGMTKNKHLARRLSDSAFGEIKRQIVYKTQARKGQVLYVNRFYPSSKLCSICDTKNDDLKLSDRVWTCSICKSHHDRDVNAAINIKKHAVSYTVAEEKSAKPVEKKALADKLPRKGRLSVKLSSTKQESSVLSIVDRFE